MSDTCKDRNRSKETIACRSASLTAGLVKLPADLRFVPGPPCSLSRDASGFRKSGHERTRAQGESVRRGLDNGSSARVRRRRHVDCTRDGSNIDGVRSMRRVSEVREPRAGGYREFLLWSFVRNFVRNIFRPDAGPPGCRAGTEKRE